MLQPENNKLTSQTDRDSIDEPIGLTAVILIVILSLLVGFSLYWNIQNIHYEKVQLAIAEARANWNKDQAFRGWATEHGGVYVAPNERTPPSPYLAHIANRDIVTTEGMKLTLMNPAYMMRQMTDEFEGTYGIKGSITGKILLNPANEPDEWERKVLDLYDHDPKEVIEQADINNEPYVRLMRPMIMKQGCILCHGHLGFKVGDVRGGVSVSIPLKPYFISADLSIDSIRITHMIVWLIGSVGVVLFVRSARRRENERHQLQSELQKNKDLLELRVEERTKELKIKEGELLKSQAREMHINKMTSLGEMASGMAHEINTPLQSINLFSHKIKKNINNKKYDDINQSLVSVEKAVNKITSIIDSLRKMSGDSHQDSYESVLIENIIEDVTEITEERYKLGNIDFTVNYDNNINKLELYCQPVQIGQILMNLLNNAYDEVMVLDKKWIRIDVQELADTVAFVVTDSGEGVPVEIQNKIFEPLYTSKEIGKGTGLGLSISSEIALKHGGNLHLDTSSPNTRFVFELPKHHAKSGNI